MERLTERHKYNGKENISIDRKKYGIICSNFCTNCGRADCDDIRKALFKLAEYEDLKEQGKLLKLPVAAGDTVYLVSFRKKCYKMSNTYLVNNDLECAFCESECVYGAKKEYFIEEIKATLPIIGNMIERPDGFMVFLTRPEAERALAEMEGKK